MCPRSPGAQSASQLFPQRNQSWPTPHGEGSFDLCFNDIRSRFAFTRYFARSKNNRHRFMKCLTIKHKGWFHHCLMNLEVFSMDLDRQHGHAKVWGIYIITWTKYMVTFANNIQRMIISWHLFPIKHFELVPLSAHDNCMGTWTTFCIFEKLYTRVTDIISNREEDDHDGHLQRRSRGWCSWWPDPSPSSHYIWRVWNSRIFNLCWAGITGKRGKH